MKILNKKRYRILFSLSHDEQFVAEEGRGTFSLLYDLLSDNGYEIDYITEPINSKILDKCQILVLGAPTYDIQESLNEEIEAVKQFVLNGGGLLLICDPKTMPEPPLIIDKIAEIANLKFKEFLNYPPNYLQIFSAHYLTTNVRLIKIGKIVSLDLNNIAKAIAFTKATKQAIVACTQMEKGRVIALGDNQCFSNSYLEQNDNEEFARNIFIWLANQHLINIEEIIIPDSIELGQSAYISIEMSNNSSKERLQIVGHLESDTDALIEESSQKNRSLPPEESTKMIWKVSPQILGAQKFRIRLILNDKVTLHFDKLPEMNCVAPGYFILEIKDKDGNLRTNFETGEHFYVNGAFKWKGNVDETKCDLVLNIDDGLIKKRDTPTIDVGIDRWHIQAVAEGTHKIELILKETGRILPALVKVKTSEQDRVKEIYTAYVHPLEVEITERLKQIDDSLCNAIIKEQPFEILSPEKFVDKVYSKNDAIWLTGVIRAARREQWYNMDLMQIMLKYIAPTYLPNYGSCIPYDPELATHLANLHEPHKKDLEYNLLSLQDSKKLSIKQNIAAYLLHEKFGHGFFYTRTQLGQQLVILHRHGLPKSYYDETDEKYNEAANLIYDSAIIVNEGFAAWLELTLINKLDDEQVKLSFDLRQSHLIYNSSTLFKYQQDSKFFQTSPPHYDSQYREGYEYLFEISKHFNERCAIRIFTIATNIDFEIKEEIDGSIKFVRDPVQIIHEILEDEKENWISHLRLFKIAKLIHDNRKMLKECYKEKYCPIDCRKDTCPLGDFIFEKLGWR